MADCKSATTGVANPPQRGVGDKGKVLLRTTHSPDRTTVVAVAAAHFLVARVETEDPRVVRVVRVERTRPVDAVVPSEVERTIPAVAGVGEEEAVAVSAGEE